MILCEGLTSERGATLVAERIGEVLEAPASIGDTQVFASVSIGIALGNASASPDSLLRDAGAAVQRAKERGGARYELFDQALHRRVGDRLQREDALRQAIAHDELRLHYQPIVALVDGRVVGLEALVRWQHPTRGLLAPGEFIELAEESGLIVGLGAWVLRETCRQTALWQRRYASKLELEVSVDISARQLADRQILEHVARAMDEAAIGRGRLALEITETVLMEDDGIAIAALEPLKRLGCRLVLDDFGTGYWSLSYIGRLPLDTLKLDRSFVAPLGPAGEGRAIVAAVTELARALDVTLLAEGIETAQQLVVLRTLGCDLGQGYHFARPLPADDVTRLLDAGHGGPPGAAAPLAR